MDQQNFFNSQLSMKQSSQIEANVFALATSAHPNHLTHTYSKLFDHALHCLPVSYFQLQSPITNLHLKTASEIVMYFR